MSQGICQVRPPKKDKSTHLSTLPVIPVEYPYAYKSPNFRRRSAIVMQQEGMSEIFHKVRSMSLPLISRKVGKSFEKKNDNTQLLSSPNIS